MKLPYITYWTYKWLRGCDITQAPEADLAAHYYTRPTECHMLIPTWEAFEAASV